MDRVVAIKLLGEAFTGDHQAVRRFMREARAAARLSSHPHVVTIFDVGEHAERPYIVMEYLAGGTVALCTLIRPKNPSATKLMPYECGITPFDNARGRYTVRFYIVAILFVVFDVETIFLFPWAVQFKRLGLFGLLEMMIFLGILIVGYIWIWKKGALEWV